MASHFREGRNKTFLCRFSLWSFFGTGTQTGECRFLFVAKQSHSLSRGDQFFFAEEMKKMVEWNVWWSMNPFLCTFALQPTLDGKRHSQSPLCWLWNLVFWSTGITVIASTSIAHFLRKFRKRVIVPRFCVLPIWLRQVLSKIYRFITDNVNR